MNLPSDVELSSNPHIISFTLNHDFSISLHFSLIAILVIFLLILTIFAIVKLIGKFLGSSLVFEEAVFGIGDQSITLKPNRVDKQIAYKIWVELSTRKIGIPIDLSDDVVTEIYDSWYNFFSVTRELIKDIPVAKYKSDSTRKIIQLSIDVLNEGLRPHLTKWQARFRWWYESELKNTENKHLNPQEMQKNFSDFDALERDLLVVNQGLITYREKMKELILN